MVWRFGPSPVSKVNCSSPLEKKLLGFALDSLYGSFRRRGAADENHRGFLGE